MAYYIKEELLISQIYIINNIIGNDEENGLTFLNNIAIHILVYLIKGLLQYHKYHSIGTLFTYINLFQYFRALTPYLKAFKVFGKSIKGWNKTIK